MNKLTKHLFTKSLLLRIGLGLLFLWSGLDKALSGFSASGYLLHATQGPLAAWFQSMAGNAWVDFLVVFGEIGIGVALVSGALLRFGAYGGILMMALFYLSVFPPEHGLINDQLIYLLIFFHLAVIGAGRHWGLDQWLEQTKLVKDYPFLEKILG